MMIANSLRSGLSRSLKSWKGVLIILICFLLLISVFALPLRKMIGSGFGASMITERLADGFDIEVFSDLGSTLSNLTSYITSGVVLIFLTGIVLNAFLTGGLFNNLKKDNTGFSASEFFRAGAVNFWSFLIISVIITFLGVFLPAVVFFIPSAIITASGSISEKGAFMMMAGAVLFVLLLLPVILLVADYSRAWKVSDENRSCFRALGFGFGETFRKLWPSYFMMLCLVLVQVVSGLIAFSILAEWKPVTGGSVFLMFIVSQILVFIRLLLKTWRYGSVMSMMENNQKIIIDNQETQDSETRHPIVNDPLIENMVQDDASFQDPVITPEPPSYEDRRD